eukprot:TRINITY_DN26272_c0_g1_i1.p1 TRINITY_DN26272_c0_g1~~TRINITY_DN26272_c0_g1_i1.p1  ORF type:complete len:224 (+),score=38.14 TRINITY_DN26272_c0_g1_i1:28-672(+)
MEWGIVGLVVVGVLVIVIGRLAMIIPGGKSRTRSNKSKTASLLVVLGSGGHTGEMMTLMKNLDCVNKYTPRYYVIAQTDEHSLHKIKAFEEGKGDGNCRFFFIYRSREVGQSYVSSVFTTLYSFISSVMIVLRTRPDLVLCNGPGTCLPICMSALIPRFFGVKDVMTMYVESVCRTRCLSLTGKLLYPFVDQFVVQWPELAEKHPKAKYYGFLM